MKIDVNSQPLIDSLSAVQLYISMNEYVAASYKLGEIVGILRSKMIDGENEHEI